MGNLDLNKPVLLISGTGRSGTTIFRKVMEQHPLVATVPEWRFLTDPGGIIEYLTLLDNGNPFIVDQAFRRLSRLFGELQNIDILSRFISKFNILAKSVPFKTTNAYYNMPAERVLPGFSVMVEELLRNLVDFHWHGEYMGMKRGQKKIVAGVVGDRFNAEKAFRDFLHNIAEAAMKQAGRPRFLEKNTWTFLHFDTISRLYPTGKLVHIHRDPRDVVASYVKQPWMPSDPVQSALLLKKLIMKWWSTRNSIDSARWIEIGLRDLVLDTEGILRDVCRFWEIDFHVDLLKVDLSRSHDGRWRRELTKEQQNQINRILEEVIDFYGYEHD